MGISAVGQGDRVSTARYVLATALVFLGMVTYFYGPPLVPSLSEAARSECNKLTGSDYRNFSLEWSTTTYSSIDAPHWVCRDLSSPARPATSLGWWAGTDGGPSRPASPTGGRTR